MAKESKSARRRRQRRKQAELQRRWADYIESPVYGKPSPDDEIVTVFDEDGYKLQVQSQWGKIKDETGGIAGRSAATRMGWTMSGRHHDVALAAKYFSIGGVLPHEQVVKLIQSAAQATATAYDVHNDADLGNAGMKLLAGMAKSYHDACMDLAKYDQQERHFDRRSQIGDKEYAYVVPPEDSVSEALQIAAQHGLLNVDPSEDTKLE